MKYIKGQSGNPNGRPKGSPNKATADIRELLLQFVKDNYEEFLRAFYSLTPEQRSTLWLKGAMHLIPKAEPEKEQQHFGYQVRIIDAQNNDLGVMD
jgi:hypothetical protein